MAKDPGGEAGTYARLMSEQPVYKSKLEKRYAAFLELRLRAGEIVKWRYEAISLRIGSGARYCPDFYVLLSDGSAWFDECKGHWREAARVRFLAAVDLYPEFRWRVVTAGARRGFDIKTPEETFKRKARHA